MRYLHLSSTSLIKIVHEWYNDLGSRSNISLQHGHITYFSHLNIKDYSYRPTWVLPVKRKVNLIIALLWMWSLFLNVLLLYLDVACPLVSTFFVFEPHLSGRGITLIPFETTHAQDSTPHDPDIFLWYDHVTYSLLLKGEDYPHRPTWVLVCFVLIHLHHRKISRRPPNIKLLQAKLVYP